MTTTFPNSLQINGEKNKRKRRKIAYFTFVLQEGLGDEFNQIDLEQNEPKAKKK